MELINCFRTSRVSIFLAMVVIFFVQPAYAEHVILESATMGPTGQDYGALVSYEQYVGARFYLDRRIEVTQIGGHIAQGVPGADFFGAIVILSGSDDLPNGYPFSGGEVVAWTVFDPGFFSSDFRTPLSVELGPGYYGLVFGTDALGSTNGYGIMPFGGQTSFPSVSYFVFWPDFGWLDVMPNDTRFVIEGNTKYCDASGSSVVEYEYIEGVQVGDIDNIPTGNSHYADYTSISTEMVKETSYPITVTRGNPWEGDRCAVWVDWNRNWDFFDVGEQISMTLNPTTFTGTITPPANAVLGDTRMRVRITWNELPFSCGDSGYGEVEDYTITVVGGDYCGASGSNVTEYQYIMGVQVGSINNIPTGNDHYADYTSLSTTMEPMVGYPLTVTRGNPWTNDRCGAWADWNQDGDFYDFGEEIIMSIGADPCTFTGTVTPPVDAGMGDTRMRVRITWNETPLPCGDSDFGEVEDYTITIPSGNTGGISGMKFFDLNGNGLRDGGEPGLVGWEIYLDLNNNAQRDTGEPNTVTGADGSYEFSDLAADTYTVTEVIQVGWRQTFPGSGKHSVVLEIGEVVGNINFGNWIPYAGGSGTAVDPYRIRTAGQMNAIGKYPEDWDKHFILNADINLSAYTAEQFNMIGFYDYTLNSIPFSGVFDGNNHSIGDFTYSYSGTTQQQIGIFSYIDFPGTEIRNVIVINPDVNTGEHGVSAGGLIGLMRGGTVSNCNVNGGKVRASNFFAGGLVGMLMDGLVTQCESDTFAIASDGSAGGVVGSIWGGTTSHCSSTGHTSGQIDVGGITGDNSGQIQYCWALGDVNGYHTIGGIAGENYGIIRESFCDGSVTASDHSAGGIAGRNFDEISNCYSTATVKAMISQSGGLVGLNGDATITNCYSAGKVTGGFKGGLVAYDFNGVVTDCFWDTEASGVGYSAAGTPKTTEQMQTKTTFTDAGWDFTTPVWRMCEYPDYPKLWFEIIEDKYGGGGGTAANPYLIYTAEQMQTIGEDSNDWDKHFKLMADIDLSAYTAEQFNMIGFYDYSPSSIPFSGVFDGNNHSIDNFTYSYSGTAQQQIGIFSYVDGPGTEIRNVIVTNPDVNSGERGVSAGSLIGLMDGGTVINCKVNGGTVRASYFEAGGLVGELYDGLVTQCDCNTFTIASDGSAGGVAGFIWHGTMSQCSSTGQTNGKYNVGGITGDNLGQILYCRASGDVNGHQHVGGVAGENGGIIRESFCDGSVTASNHDAGGIAGRNFDEISNCYSTATVTAMSYQPGGLAGLNWDGTITNCYSTGKVTGLFYGGLVAYDVNGVVTGCFWDTEASGVGYSAAGTPKTTEQMQTKTTFTDAGWDFVGETVNGPNDIWDICEGTNYPKLVWQIPIADFVCPDGVNFFDFSFFASQWAEENCAASNDCDGRDLDQLGSVDIKDHRIFADNWLAGL